MRTDFLDLAVASALVRLHFDKFRSLELKGQAHSHTNNLFDCHYLDFKSVKDFREMQEVPLRLSFNEKRHFSVG